jgi:hypothetical protein
MNINRRKLMKDELKKIIKEELIKESLISNILSFVAGWAMKGSANKKNPEAKKIVGDVTVKKAVEDYVQAHKSFVDSLNAIEKEYGVEYPSWLKEPLKKPLY